MGKRGGKRRENKTGAASSSGLHTSLSLREEASGRKQSHNPKLLLKLTHLQNLADWATKEASISSLGAFFGCRFAEFGETLGIRPDPSLFPCQRCETLLQPGFNCSVRIEKNRAKRQRRHGKTNLPTQNNVVYTCNFCSHRNLKRGTPKGHMREICPLKTNISSKLKAGKPLAQRSDNAEKGNTNKVEAQEAIETPLPTTSNITSSFPDSQAATVPKLLDSNRSKGRNWDRREQLINLWLAQPLQMPKMLAARAPQGKGKSPGLPSKRLARVKSLREIRNFRNFQFRSACR